MLLLVAVSVFVACSGNVNRTLTQTVENHLFGLNHSVTYLSWTFILEVKLFSSLYTFTWTKLELSVKSNQLSWRHYSATHAVPPYVCCGLLLRKALYHVSLKLLHKGQFSATHAQYLRGFFSAAAFRSSEQFVNCNNHTSAVFQEFSESFRLVTISCCQ